MPTPTYAMQIDRTGGPEVFRRVEISVPDPGPGEVLLRQSAIGLNFIDVYHRTGQFGGHDNVPLPCILGMQGTGIVEAVGAGVEKLQPGDRAGYPDSIGAYAEKRLVRADRLIRVPSGLSDATVAATLLRGLTAEYLIRRLYRVQPGDRILVHAAAGGVGVILAQWARSLGAVVIGTVRSTGRVATATEHGCHHVVLTTDPNWPAQVLALTGGQGVAVVYDSIGRVTFRPSLGCLRERGMAINYGTTSGQVEEFPLQALHRKSLTVCRPTLPSFIRHRDEYEAAGAAFFDVLGNGTIRLPQMVPFGLGEVAQAHRAFEAGRIEGLPVLIP